MNPLILIRGGGDLASWVALRLHRVGFQVAILELEHPLAVRRKVCFSEAAYEGVHTVEEVTARLVSADQLQGTIEAGEIPVLIDPGANILRNQLATSPHSTFVIDARIAKSDPEPLPVTIPFHIGLGPGFSAGENCHAVIETRRSHTLGRVLWNRKPQPDSGQPEGDPRRVLRAPANGFVTAHVNIGDQVREGQPIAEVQAAGDSKKHLIESPFNGVLRGIIHPRVEVTEGLKIGDVDPRNDASACFLVSDKSLAVGGGVLEAVLIKLREMGDSLS
jgi:xanthine dehydrogenase accessory factor